MTTKTELLLKLKQIEYDLSVTRTRVTEITAEINRLPSDHFPAPSPRLYCNQCPGTYRTARDLAEHAYRVHNGPLPEHIAAAEARAGDPEAMTRAPARSEGDA